MTHEQFLARCIELAAEALEAGHQPFGSVLVDADGRILAEEMNREGAGDPTAHPELALAQWAAGNLSPAERATATVYTSGEHCAMCSAAHAWCGLGPIVYASSTEQTAAWYAAAGLPPSPVLPLPIQAVAPGIEVTGPFPELAEQVHALHQRRWAGRE